MESPPVRNGVASNPPSLVRSEAIDMRRDMSVCMLRSEMETADEEGP